jgi:hypothetical protein
MRIAALYIVVAAALCAPATLALTAQVAVPSPRAAAGDAADDAVSAAQRSARARALDDVAALQTHRPAYPFWRHIFTIPDGAIVYGSAADGRLLATFPSRGDWTRDATWNDQSLRSVLSGQQLSRDLAERRDEVARLFEGAAGPVLHNATRGWFLLPNERRYGTFLEEWGAIYERFGVPAELGLAQALVESGLNGRARSEARAIGLCQWLLRNWDRLKRLSPHVIEGYNQTTQAPYCAAYLSILATKYGSFIPALSEHHAGGTNIGRTLINGERLGGATTRQRYFLGSDFARDLRTMFPGTYRDVYGSYGPRSTVYAEMVFGNIANVERIRSEVVQSKIYAMRLSRALTPADIGGRTGLSSDEVRRYNPALTRRVPAGATVYLPWHVASFGRDVAFWHRPPSRTYAMLLEEFVRLDISPEEWDSAVFDGVLEGFRARFAATGSEEGTVMATTLAYAMQDRRTSAQAQILAEFRTSEHILRLFEQARERRDTFRAANAVVPPITD